MHTTLRYTFWAVLAIVGFAHPTAGQAAEAGRPNIILILADDMGYGDAGCYGGKMIPTPSIDRLAAGGVRFTDGYVVSPVCGPSRVGLLSGAYPQRFGVHWNDDIFPAALPGLRLPEAHLTLPEALRLAGYATGHLGKWNFPRDARKACDEVDDLMNWGGAYFPNADGSYNYVNDGPEEKDYPQGVWGPNPPGEYLTDRIGRHAVEFIERHRGKEKPFFLYLAFNAPHSPYQAKQALRARLGGIRPEPLDVYAAMVASMDENIGRVMDKLRAEGLLDNTVVVFTSDNGPAPPLRVGDWKPEWPKDLTVGSAGPLSGRKATFLEGGIREPFLLHWPARLKAGEYRRPVSTLDLYPTLCAIAGAKVPAATKLDGIDLLPYLLHQKQGDPHATLYWAKHDDLGGVRQGDWKLLLGRSEPKLQLFNLAEDAAEKHDLAADNPELVARLHATWLAWHAQLAPSASETAKGVKGSKKRAKKQALE